MKDSSKTKQAKSKSESGEVEQALKDSKESGWTLLNSIQEGYYEVDLAGTYTFFNSSMSKILGYTEEEMIGMNYRLYTDKENAEKIFRDFNEVYRTGISSKLDYEQIKKDGSKLYVETSVALMRDLLGQTIGFRGIVRDITERRQMEEALRESGERYRDMIENSSDLIQSVDIEGKFIFVNSAWYESLGYTEEELPDLSLFQIIHPDSMAHCQRIFQDIMSGHSVKDTQAKFVSKSGRFIIVEGNVVPRMVGTQVIATLGFFRDITERKRADEALQESELLFRKVFEDHAAVKLIIDPCTGNIIDANKAAASFYGWSCEQLKQMKIQEINTFSPEEVKENMEKARAEKKIHFEFRHRRADGSVRDVDVFSSKIEVNKKDLLHSIIYDSTNRKQAEEQLKNTLESLRKALSTTIQVMVSAIEVRDPYTSGHQTRSADLARAIATEMGLPQDTVEGIRMAGSIHDIGKLSIPAEILSKPTNLSAIELLLIKEHTNRGYEILKDVESPWPLAEIVRQHHERMDGSGYPRNLKGDDILIEARILAVADVVEAMASHRPYRPGLGIDAALNEIEKNSGIFYDKTAADACLILFREKGFKLAQA
jgi:PAS domain S-box-containing protein